MFRSFLLLSMVLCFNTLLFSSESDIIQKSLENKLHLKTEWKILLHYDVKNNLKINDNRFILSDNFTLQNELTQTIHNFYSQPLSQCRFPARLLYITHELNISKDSFPSIECQELDKYKSNAIVDKIHLIYASEDVKNPSSMMGHVFFKYEGKKKNLQTVSHALAFYTVIDTTNIPKLIYQNTISGMKGIFSLQPYDKVLFRYLNDEKRNVWEYELSTTNYKKELLYYHIWELKDINIQYYFTSYNCATVVYNLLSLINPKIYYEENLWITPLQSVKIANKYNIIKKSTLLPSNLWLIKMLKEQLSDSEIDMVKGIIKNNDLAELENLNIFQLRFLLVINNLKYQKKNIDKNQYNSINNSVLEKLKYNKQYLDISKYKNPFKIPAERQINIGMKKLDNTNYMQLSFLPASHLIHDNNREYFGETQLKIFYLSLLFNHDNIKLDMFDLYNVYSLIPYDVFTTPMSYKFKVSIENDYDSKFDSKNITKIEGGIGIDYEMHHDINFYLLLNAGVRYSQNDKFNLVYYPEVGLSIYEIFNLKSNIMYQKIYIDNSKIDKYRFVQSLFISQDKKLLFSFERNKYQNNIKDKFSLSFVKYF